MQKATAIQAGSGIAGGSRGPQQAIELMGQQRRDQHHDEPRAGQPAEPDRRREQRRQADAVERP